MTGPRAPSQPAPGVDDVDALLPQTQCQRCGYPDCASYAAAIVHEGAAINRCPPGGADTVVALARLTGGTVEPVDPTCGVPGPRLEAVIDEAWCIGCTKCIQACPVDAIVGAARRMHVILSQECTGCELCLPPCPVECIELVPATWGPEAPGEWLQQQAGRFRERYRRRGSRLARPRAVAPREERSLDGDSRRALIAEAVRRRRARPGGRIVR